jgi:hypothetical protein
MLEREILKDLVCSFGKKKKKENLKSDFCTARGQASRWIDSRADAWVQGSGGRSNHLVEHAKQPFGKGKKKLFSPQGLAFCGAIPALQISTRISRLVAQPWSRSHHRRWRSHRPTSSSRPAPPSSWGCPWNGKIWVCHIGL